jgi:hypothetical protein
MLTGVSTYTDAIAFSLVVQV